MLCLGAQIAWSPLGLKSMVLPIFLLSNFLSQLPINTEFAISSKIMAS